MAAMRETLSTMLWPIRTPTALDAYFHFPRLCLTASIVPPIPTH